MNADSATFPRYDFAAAERDQLASWCGLSTRQKIEFFEEMVELAWLSGALAPERLALRDEANGPAEGV